MEQITYVLNNNSGNKIKMILISRDIFHGSYKTALKN